jgi:hypothetical protein
VPEQAKGCRRTAARAAFSPSSGPLSADVAIDREITLHDHAPPIGGAQQYEVRRDQKYARDPMLPAQSIYAPTLRVAHPR